MCAQFGTQFTRRKETSNGGALPRTRRNCEKLPNVAATACLGIVFFLTGAEASDQQHSSSSVVDATANEAANKAAYANMVASFCFALCLSIVAVGMGYFALCEYDLLRLYATQGKTVQGKVVAQCFLRGSNPTMAVYRVTVDYPYPQAGGHTAILRKQLECHEWDFLYQHDNSVENEFGFCNNIVQWQMDEEQFSQFSHTADMVMTFESPKIVLSHTHKMRYIELLVLEDFPQSAVTKNSIRMGMRHQLPMIGLVTILALLAVFCTYLGLDTQDNFIRRSRLSLLVSAIAMVIVLLLVHTCLGDTVQTILHREYLEGGELMVQMDASSTIGSTLSTDLSAGPVQNSYRVASPSRMVRDISSLSAD